MHIKKFKESKLLDIDNFFSSLKGFRVSEKEYQRAFDIWKVFKIKKWENIRINI